MKVSRDSIFAPLLRFLFGNKYIKADETLMSKFEDRVLNALKHFNTFTWRSSNGLAKELKASVPDVEQALKNLFLKKMVCHKKMDSIDDDDHHWAYWNHDRLMKRIMKGEIEVVCEYDE